MEIKQAPLTKLPREALMLQIRPPHRPRSLPPQQQPPLPLVLAMRHLVRLSQHFYFVINKYCQMYAKMYIQSCLYKDLWLSNKSKKV